MFAACIGLSGCCGPALNLRGDGFNEAGFPSAQQPVRRPDGDGDYFGFSNKSRQIEQSLGY